jgi:putative nucleotidyltransferase with HDIG domain
MDINKNKELFLEALGFSGRLSEELENWLTSSDFFTAPASTRFHLSKPGGLCQHSINVYNRLRQINDSLGLEIDKSSVAVCGLLHDICKANFYSSEKRNRKVNGKWEEYDAYTVDDRFPIGHGEKSVIIIQKYMEITAQEALAIRWHMGAYNASYQDGCSISAACKMDKLVLALQMADQAATFWDENEVK